MKLLGYTFGKDKESQEELQSITPEQNDGSAVITTGDNGGFIDPGTGSAVGYSLSLDLDPTIVSEQQLISRYREMALIPEVEKAVDIIVNEMVSTSDPDMVSLDLDQVEISENQKELIREEFKNVLKLMNFNSTGFETIKRWYVDGRFQYQVVVDSEKYKTDGIGKLVYIDPRKLKKVNVLKKDVDSRTGVDLYANRDKFWIFSEDGFSQDYSTNTGTSASNVVQIAEEAIVQTTSGLLNTTNTIILSWLHKAFRPLNQLKSLEDASIIYRLSRAPERRVFYIDVGNLPTAKAEQVLQRQMQQYKSKMVYDTTTGSVRSDPKHMTMIEDYWLPRRSDGKATEITTLPGGQNLGEMDEVNYFLNKLYNSLNVPVTRMDPSQGFALGRNTEITRDEVSLMKFIVRLRKRFSRIFIDLLKIQLVLKGTFSSEEFEEFEEFINITFNADNHWDEMLDNEVWTGRLEMLERVTQHMGTYFSHEWISKNILRLSDEESEEISKQIKDEIKAKMYPDPSQDQD